MQSGKRVLISEPDSKLASQLAGQLEANGYRVTNVPDVSRATHLVKTEVFDAYIMALELKGMGGLQAAAAMKTSRPDKQAPIFLLVETPDQETVKRAAHIGGAQLLVKPVKAEDLLAKVMDELKPVRPQGGSAYDVRIINVFLEAVRETLEFYLDNQLSIGKPKVKTGEQAIGYLSSLIGFTGESVKGSMAMSFQKTFLVRISKKIFPVMSIELGDDMLADMAGEMCNQVCGAVKNKFAGLGLKVMIGLPKVVVGKNHRVIHIVKNPVLWLPIDYSQDKSSIEFCMDRSNESLPEVVEGEETAKGGDVLLF